MSNKTVFRLATIGACLGAASLLAHADQWSDISQRKELRC
eukprot:gene60113-80170_t